MYIIPDKERIPIASMLIHPALNERLSPGRVAALRSVAIPIASMPTHPARRRR